ncbi:MAG: AAA family ATPase [Hallerella succinigenes]|uniref:ATP-binding protein n=1 Tax=Hallerella succinigenes TaxID=1896222 RepID=UPI0023F3DD5E|nr:AAA family ATPase [Hallerella succinigenes]MDD6091212.1 AAA family ATPase [Hallerella succinigenes]
MHSTLRFWQHLFIFSSAKPSSSKGRARRIGKSTIVETFAQHEYKSYILIDFNDCEASVKKAFDKMSDLNSFFTTLSYTYGITLHPRDSVIIFDEVQKFPKARQSVKKLVKDGRFDYIETGSLISINENVKDITIPSEETSIQMYPMDFEEFCEALGKPTICDYIRECFDKGEALERNLHNDAMQLFKQYMLIGGMPQSIVEFLEHTFSFKYSDRRKRSIIALYKKDIQKIKGAYKSKVLSTFLQIPAFLSKHEKRVTLSRIESGINTENTYENTFMWLSNSMITNNCLKSSDPNVGLGLNGDDSAIKCYMGDTGLLFSHAFSENAIARDSLYKQIMNDKLSINKGMLYENAIAQMLTANGHRLYFYTRYNKELHRNDMEIDFLLSDSASGKVIPIEVKSSKNYTTSSLTDFKKIYKKRIGKSYIIHPKNYFIKENGTICIPPYMTICL